MFSPTSPHNLCWNASQRYVPSCMKQGQYAISLFCDTHTTPITPATPDMRDNQDSPYHSHTPICRAIPMRRNTLKSFNIFFNLKEILVVSSLQRFVFVAMFLH